MILRVILEIIDNFGPSQLCFSLASIMYLGVLFFEKMGKSYAYEMIVICSVLMTYLKLDTY